MVTVSANEYRNTTVHDDYAFLNRKAIILTINRCKQCDHTKRRTIAAENERSLLIINLCRSSKSHPLASDTSLEGCLRYGLINFVEEIGASIMGRLVLA